MAEVTPEAGPRPGTDVFAVVFGRRGPRWSDAPPVMIGLLATVAIHFAGYTAAPYFPLPKPKETVGTGQEAYEVVIDLYPGDDPDDRFVETNPQVPSHEPLEAENFAARDQEASQEAELDPKEPDETRPTIDPEEDPGHKTASGEVPSEPEPIAAPPPAPDPVEPEEFVAVPPPPPPPLGNDFDRTDTPEDDEGILSVTGADPEVEEDPPEPDPEEAPKEIPLVADDAGEDDPREVPEPVADPPPVPVPPGPRPRPKVSAEVFAGPLIKSQGRAPRGLVAVNAKFKQFGEYLQMMSEVIVTQWHALNHASASVLDRSPAYVTVEFKIDRTGAVTAIDVIESRTDASKVARFICQDAIRSRSPFGPWTEEMIDELEEEETIVFNFRYNYGSR